MLTQLKQGNIFDMQNECARAQDVNKVSNLEIFRRICRTIGYSSSSTDIVAKTYRDQDKGIHLVFVRESDLTDTLILSPEIKNFFHSFYNNTYFSGTYCLNTSNLFTQKNCIRYSSNEEGFEEAKLSALTVQSIIKTVTYGEDLQVMVLFQHWLHALN